MENFSVLREQVMRPLSVALGQAFANAKLGDDRRMAIINRLYASLRPVDQLRCRDELHQCKMAKRGRMEARIT